MQVLRERRRTIEISLHQGQMVVHVPRRLSRAELERTLPALRERLWRQLRRRSVFDNDALQARATRVAHTVLGDVHLPRFTARFSRRQHKRWGSCTVGRGGDGRPLGSILISARLIGHPVWVLDHLLLHELAHLLVSDHGARFQQLMRRSPRAERAEGYLEALENTEQMGARFAACGTDADDADDDDAAQADAGAAQAEGRPQTPSAAQARPRSTTSPRKRPRVAPGPLPLFASLAEVDAVDPSA